MIKKNGCVIVENKEDWVRHYDKNWGRFNGCTFGGGTRNNFLSHTESVKRLVFVIGWNLYQLKSQRRKSQRLLINN